MNEKTISADILNSYPKVDEKAIDAMLAEEMDKTYVKFIVLDDDPTGVQTVHDISVYTDWSVESIRSGFAEKNRVFYILTNSRGFTQEQTENVHAEIAENIARVAKETGIKYMVMSRSDSTLRGHYPVETEVLDLVFAENKCRTAEGEILCYFFKEGGRYTIDDVHYVRYGNELVPAGNTEFAKDKTFGYSSSNLREYVEEKSYGRFPKESVTSISLDELRAVDIEKILNKILYVIKFNKIIVNAIDYCDIKVFAVALYKAIAIGKNYMFRTAAGLVKVLGGISDRPLLAREEMITKSSENGGLVVVGSHTAKTTEQLNELLTLDGVVPVEFDSDKVLEGDEALFAEVDRCVALEEEIIRSGKTAVCYTRRKLLSLENDTPEEALLRSVKISEGVCSLVGKLSVAPAFIIGKGGITSSDIGTKALKVKRANVLGQIRPGIPVWQTGEESRFPSVPYVIFPGNVGDKNTLREAAEILIGGKA